MSKFYLPLCNESFLLSTVIIMSNKSVHHTGNYLANEKKKKLKFINKSSLFFLVS